MKKRVERKETKQIEKKEVKKGFVWYSLKALRICFYVMLCLLLLPQLSWFGYCFGPCLLILTLLSLFTLIVSIIHLVKYKKRIFPIIAILVSFIALFFCIWVIRQIY